MEQIILQDLSTGTKQGWYSTTSKTGHSSSILTMNFNTPEIEEFSKIINNILIESAELHLSCTSSGFDRRKNFQLKMYSGETLTTDYGTDFISENNAYNNTDVKLILTSESVEKWLKTPGEKKITSIDPQAKLYYGSGPWYSYNYVKANNSWLVINYTYKNSKIFLEKNSIDISDKIVLTIDSFDSTYTHKIKLILDDQEYLLGENLLEGEYSFNIPFENFKEKMIDKILIPAELEITTFSNLGSYSPEKYPISIIIDQRHAPTLEEPSLEIETFQNFTEQKIILPEKNNLKLSFSATGQESAFIESYYIQFNNGLETIVEENFLNFKIPSLYAGAVCDIKIKAKDSRGYFSDTKTLSVYVTNYYKPTLQINTFFRADKDGLRDDINGTYAFVKYQILKPIVKNIQGILVENYLVKVNCKIEEELFLDIKSEEIFGDSFEKEKTYKCFFYLQDSFNLTTEDTPVIKELNSSSFLLHFRKNQNSVGVGCTAPDINEIDLPGLVTFGWPINLLSPLEVKQGGTGVDSPEQLQFLIGNLMYPIGSIYISTSSTNPSSLFGGTWVAWGAGRVPVGVDFNNDNFNSAELTGGSADAILVSHYHTPYNSQNLESETDIRVFNTSLNLNTDSVARKHVDEGTSSDSYAITAKTMKDLDQALTTSTEGIDGMGKNLQPYITCYMWKRTE